jgi:glucosyl-dolichyl phosphate glucuronosyltransferase
VISIIVATHNGTPTLPLTLEAFCGLGLSADAVEILAVDNASTDGTRSVLERYSAALPMRVLVEPRKGKSFALNRALGVARGELIVFADDDVLPEPGWLDAYRAAAAEHPEVDVFSGQVRHHWQKEPPGWLRRLADEGRSYGGTPTGHPAGPVPPSFFKGANFMIRRRVAEAVRFCEQPGVNFAGNTVTAGGEDTLFVQQAQQRGHRTYYVPGASVRHIVRPHQVGVYPVLQRYVRIGRAMTLGNPNQFDPDGARVLGYPRYLFKTVPQGVLRALRLWASGNSYAAADNLIGIAMDCGRAQQWRKVMLGSEAAGGGMPPGNDAYGGSQ